jgi:GNAT superfamily N-acetyltransferase
VLIINAEFKDLQEILNLQYLAYQSEAKLHNNYTIPPLTQTLEELVRECDNGILLKAIDDNNVIIGSVRGYIESNTLFIGKLMVHPKHQGNGIGSQLLHAIEQFCPECRYELFTSEKSTQNLQFYEKMGYRRFMEKSVTPGLKLIYLEKNN